MEKGQEQAAVLTRLSKDLHRRLRAASFILEEHASVIVRRALEEYLAKGLPPKTRRRIKDLAEGG